ncbi:hypothetical protein G5I_03454 [Acromyrmex echinatior]|uniref:Uncharacterized protein n=1 Tax=Acromyrmex echinatior TaxID=103372 RepID=F4WD14_ACREC|nr:hypothetical protein G5I_03454 [Acromyrmex echinatior]
MEGEEPRPRVTVTEEDLKSPYFRPHLQGVSKQLNPLATDADKVAPASRRSPSKREGKTDRRDDEDARIERVLERLLLRLLKGMGVVPATAPPPKGPPTKQGGQPPAKQGGQPSAKKGSKVAPKAAVRKDPPPPVITPTVGDGGHVAGDKEAPAKRAPAKAAKAEAAPPWPTPKSAKAPAAPAPTKKGSGGKAGGAAKKGSTAAGPKASGCGDRGSPRRAITGAIIWEVRGPESRGKADKLAEKLAAVFVDRDDVKGLSGS